MNSQPGTSRQRINALDDDFEKIARIARNQFTWNVLGNCAKHAQ